MRLPFIFLLLFFCVPFASAGTLPVAVSIIADNGSVTVFVDGAPGITTTVPGNITTFINVNYPENQTLIPVFNGTCPSIECPAVNVSLNLSCPAPSVSCPAPNITSVTNITYFIQTNLSNLTDVFSCGNGTTVFSLPNGTNLSFINPKNLTITFDGVSREGNGLVSCPAIPAAPACNCDNTNLVTREELKTLCAPTAPVVVPEVVNRSIVSSQPVVQTSAGDFIGDNLMYIAGAVIVAIVLYLFKDKLPFINKKKQSAPTYASYHPQQQAYVQQPQNQPYQPPSQPIGSPQGLDEKKL